MKLSATLLHATILDITGSLLKKKSPIRALERFTPLQFMRLNDRAVKVVANAPIPNAVCSKHKSERGQIKELTELTGLPRVLLTVLGTKKGYGFP